MRSYTNWLYALVIVLIACAFIWSNIHLKQERSKLTEERAQLIEQIKQIDKEAAEILRRSRRYEEMIKRYKLEQEVFDDIELKKGHSIPSFFLYQLLEEERYDKTR